MPDDEKPVPVGTPPVPERAISDVETLRAISDPLRLRILEVMTADPDTTFTVKRLASVLGTSQTKLYHHVNTLVERDLIVVAGQRVVSGIIETSYRIGQLSLRLDRSLLATDPSIMHDTLTTVFEGARDQIERGLRAGVITIDEDAAPETKLVLASGFARLDPARAAEFRARLVELYSEFGGLTKSEPATADDGALPAFGLLVGFYPVADPIAHPHEETDR